MAAESKPIKRVLVIGEAGDGKSTLVDGMRDKAKSEMPATGRAPGGVTKSMNSYAGKNLDGCVFEIIDSPGIGDHDVTPAKLLPMLSSVLHSGIHGLIVTHPLTGCRIGLGGQIVRFLVDSGFVGGEDKYDHVILAGTKKDKADPEDVALFPEVHKKWFGGSSGMHGQYATIDKCDYKELESAIQALPGTPVQWQDLKSEVVAAFVAQIMGLDEEQFRKDLEREQAKLEEELAELQKQVTVKRQREQNEKDSSMSVASERSASFSGAKIAEAALNAGATLASTMGPALLQHVTAMSQARAAESAAIAQARMAEATQERQTQMLLASEQRQARREERQAEQEMELRAQQFKMQMDMQRQQHETASAAQQQQSQMMMMQMSQQQKEQEMQCAKTLLGTVASVAGAMAPAMGGQEGLALSAGCNALAAGMGVPAAPMQTVPVTGQPSHEDHGGRASAAGYVQPNASSAHDPSTLGPGVNGPGGDVSGGPAAAARREPVPPAPAVSKSPGGMSPVVPETASQEGSKVSSGLAAADARLLGPPAPDVTKSPGGMSPAVPETTSQEGSTVSGRPAAVDTSLSAPPAHAVSQSPGGVSQDIAK